MAAASREAEAARPCAALAAAHEDVRRAFLRGKATSDEPAGAEDAWIAQ